MKMDNPDLEQRLQDVQHVVISASHDIYKSRSKVDKDTIDGAEAYRREGLSCISYKFRRAADDDIDENKALMPAYRDVPLVAHNIIARIRQGFTVAVVGSAEVKLVVDGLRDYLGVTEDRLKYVPEGKSYAENVKKGRKALGLKKGQRYLFEPADVILDEDVSDLCADPDVAEYDCVANFNGQESAFSDTTEFFPRNYNFDFTDLDGIMQPTKECNKMVFSKRFPLWILNALYRNREKGRLNILPLLTLGGAKFLTRYHSLSQHTKEVIRYNRQSLALRKEGIQRKFSFSAATAKEIMQAIFNRKLLIKADHKEPFRIKDIDAWHDLWYYQHIFDEVKQRYPDSSLDGLEHISRYAEDLVNFNERMQKIKGQIGVLKDFRGYANKRASDLQMEQQPFNKDGTLAIPPAKGEDIGASVDYLIQRKKKKTA